MRRLVRPVLLAFALAPACGDASGASTETGGDTSPDLTTSTGETSSPGGATSTSSGETTSSGSASGTPTTSVEPTSSTGETTTTTGGESTTGAATTSETSDDGTSTGTTGAPVSPVTRAWWVDGVSLQLRVIQQDDEAGLCRGLILESLMTGAVDGPGLEPIEQPAEWAVRYVFVHDTVDACFDPYDWWMNEPAYAESGVGVVTFSGVDIQGKPMSLDIDVTGSFEPGAPWIPEEDPLVAADVAVEVG
ncbi:hypothetical protein [Nannocystis punicea]|uniref:Uncharacterized protein n=1 Tax=Nannocystis punicea TaxID=2995304 RepID=A0ABY7HE60_9BACT|nr:hypothetical protein [Nannocystis poenicansa]WAS97370.1 hypothetical protein O0S08_14580 [Nannocystis poenicansa]